MMYISRTWPIHARHAVLVAKCCKLCGRPQKGVCGRTTPREYMTGRARGEREDTVLRRASNDASARGQTCRG